jgi:hypothetical protein
MSSHKICIGVSVVAVVIAVVLSILLAIYSCFSKTCSKADECACTKDTKCTKCANGGECNMKTGVCSLEPKSGGNKNKNGNDNKNKNGNDNKNKNGNDNKNKNGNDKKTPAKSLPAPKPSPKPAPKSLPPLPAPPKTPTDASDLFSVSKSFGMLDGEKYPTEFFGPGKFSVTSSMGVL